MPYLVDQVGISLEIIGNGTLIAENIFEKSCRKIWRKRKSPYLCSPFRKNGEFISNDATSF